MPFRGIVAETLTWSLPCLLYPRRPGHPRGRLLAFAALNTLSLAAANHAVSRDPEILQDTRWLISQSVFTWLRYIAYTAVIPRQTYWRGSLDNMAFFSQVWWPITLWGAARGPRWAAAAGPVHGYLFYVTSAWANGEPLIPPPDVRRNIVNYCNTAIRSGLVFAIIIRTMHRASVEAEAEREAISRRLAAQEEERSIRRQELLVREDVAVSLLRVQSLGRQLLSGGLADTIAAHIDDALSKPWNNGTPPVGTSIDIIRFVAADCLLTVELRGNSPVLDVQSTGVLEAITYTAFDNIRLYASPCRVTASVTHEHGRLTMRIADDGAGLIDLSLAFQPHHGLTRAREYVKDLGGDLHVSANVPRGLAVEAWWPYEPS
ncbi:MAG TPA: hypothetical protein VMU94_23590 [Streptosporangiaceae bacterium]|nr:hypothetical protein [Streptosporangiaceae bacterium]